MDTVDTIGKDAHNIPDGYWFEQLVLGYVTGSPDIKWPESERIRFPHWAGIDQSPSPDPMLGIARVDDVEPGAASIATAVRWCEARHRAGGASTCYVSENTYHALRQAITDAGIPHVTYGVANWNLSRAAALRRLGCDVVWVQYASPSSHPDMILPGSKLTLTEANCDLGVCLDGWPTFHPLPHTKLLENLPRATVTYDPDDGSWQVVGVPFGQEVEE